MFRAALFAVGLWVLLCGLCLAVVERCSLRVDAGTAAKLPFAKAEESTVWLEPPLWLAFAAVSLGAVLTLYAAALPWRPPEHFRHRHWDGHRDRHRGWRHDHH